MAEVPSVFLLDELFRKDRPSLVEHNRSDIPRLFNRMMAEVREAEEEVRSISQGKDKRQALADEMADIILFCFEIIRSVSHDPEMTIREKIGRNVSKYTSKPFLNGSSVPDEVEASRWYWKDRLMEDLYQSPLR